MSHTIAFIGLGNMGGPMAANLVAAGHTVVGFDLVPAALETARGNGIEIAPDAPSAVRDADVIITMLPSGRHVLSTYQGSEAGPGLLAAARPGSLFIDCSTIAVDEAREAHAAAVAAGHRALDAPVSGGVVGAQGATLAFMVGGADAEFAAAEPLLAHMGRRIVHCGGPGLGQAAKVCNNMILAISMIGVSEAFVLGEKLGLTNQALFDVAANASGQCWALTTNCPVPGPVPTSPANNDYRPGFAGALMLKDLGLAEQAFEVAGVRAEMGELAARMFREFTDGGGADRDFSAIITMIRDRAAEGNPS